MILLDTADVLAVGGELTLAMTYCDRALVIARQLQEHASPSDRGFRRYCMGVARALVMKQHIAYQIGDAAGSLSFREAALPWLALSADFYGQVKSLYFLGLLELHRGNLGAADHAAKQAVDWAERLSSEVNYDLLWNVRDGVSFGASWWSLHTASLRLETLLLLGREGAKEYAVAAQAYRVARSRAWWACDFPPFSPPHLWMATPGRTRSRTLRQFEDWITGTKSRGYLIYLADIYVSWGDYLVSLGDVRSARDRYGEADRLSVGKSTLDAQVARQRISRLADHGPFR